MTEDVEKQTGLIVNSHNATKELAILEEIEARLDAIPTNRTNEVLFRNIDNWLIPDAKIWEILPYPISRLRSITASAIPNFPPQSPFSALSNYLFAQRICTRTSASAICFKTNVRAFYLSKQPLTLWRPIQPESSEVLHKSMALRDQYNHRSGFLTPRVIAQEIESETPYILEEMITGRPFGQSVDWALLIDKVLPPLFRFYEQEFIRHHPAAEIYNASLIYQGAAKAISVFKDKKWLGLPERLLNDVGQCLLLGDETLPLCIGHGDLTWTNLIVAADGNIFLLDWERSREQPIAEEWIKMVRHMVRKHPYLIQRVFLELRRLTEDPAVMSPKRQFLLASLNMIAGWSNLGKYHKAKRWLRLASNLFNLPE